MPDGMVATKQTRAINKSIEERLLQEMEEEKRVIKCLLLGAGECGKSTILKQMKILHLNGFTEDEKKNYRPLIFRNTLESIQTLCAACEQLQIPYAILDNKRRATNIMKLRPENPPMDIAKDIKALWKEDAIQRAYSRNNEFHLLDSAPYFLTEVDRLFQDDYIPTQQDILRSR